MGTVYNSCFRLKSSEPYIEDAECAATTAATTATGNPPAPSPPTPYVPFSSRMGCGSGEKKVKIIFEKDNYNENKWQVKSRSSGQTVWNCNANGNYCLTETAEKCLREDNYDVIMEDGNSDGCPRFELHMEDSSGQWRPLITRCYNGATWTRHFHTKQVSMTQRERQWLDAHNSRRYVLLALVLVWFGLPSTFNQLTALSLSASLFFLKCAGRSIGMMDRR
jgi:hypothetical protein